MTNADKVRAMTDEELAYILMAANGVIDGDATNEERFIKYLAWLKQEVQDD